MNISLFFVYKIILPPLPYAILVLYFFSSSASLSRSCVFTLVKKNDYLFATKTSESLSDMSVTGNLCVGHLKKWHQWKGRHIFIFPDCTFHSGKNRLWACIYILPTKLTSYLLFLFNIKWYLSLILICDLSIFLFSNGWFISLS